MEKKAILIFIKKILLKIIYWFVSLLILCNAMIILGLHLVVPFFPILFLFNFCFWLGHPLFVKYVLKKSGMNAPKMVI